uniref:50S ribosomal protein L7/L12 n=1 Tax=candidate division CPR3 bacterium TaxID=2268181 RepID=A0A7C4R5D2_UNCC3
MTTNNQKEGDSNLDIVRHLLESAEAQIRSAKQLLSENPEKNKKLKKLNLDQKASELNIISEGRIIEGVFDGEMMIGPDKKKYPVPANYASKSKFVAGDILKLTIENDGSFVYKQIRPIERKRLVGSLLFEDDQYKVLAGGKPYKVLLASVTYFKLAPGDTVTVAIPENEDSDWAAIESAAITD